RCLERDQARGARRGVRRPRCPTGRRGARGGAAAAGLGARYVSAHPRAAGAAGRRARLLPGAAPPRRADGRGHAQGDHGWARSGFGESLRALIAPIQPFGWLHLHPTGSSLDVTGGVPTIPPPAAWRVVVQYLRIEETPPLKEPVLIAAFAGWSDAAQAATSAARY